MDLFIEEERSYVLFLSGVFIEDCLEYYDIIEEPAIDYHNIKTETINSVEESESEIIESDSDDDTIYDIENIENIEYKPAPKYFINKNNWINSTNLLCCYCHDKIQKPFPIPIEKSKILIPDSDECEKFILLGSLDEALTLSSKNNIEVIGYKLRDILACSICCAGNYVKKIRDDKVTNIKESIKMMLNIYKELYDDKIEDIPDKELWINMVQYNGTGLTKTQYRNKYMNQEIKFKSALFQ